MLPCLATAVGAPGSCSRHSAVRCRRARTCRCCTPVGLQQQMIVLSSPRSLVPCVADRKIIATAPLSWAWCAAAERIVALAACRYCSWSTILLQLALCSALPPPLGAHWHSRSALFVLLLADSAVHRTDSARAAVAAPLEEGASDSIVACALRRCHSSSLQFEYDTPAVALRSAHVHLSLQRVSLFGAAASCYCSRSTTLLQLASWSVPLVSAHMPRQEEAFAPEDGHDPRRGRTEYHSNELTSQHASAVGIVQCVTGVRTVAFAERIVWRCRISPLQSEYTAPAVGIVQCTAVARALVAAAPPSLCSSSRSCRYRRAASPCAAGHTRRHRAVHRH
jgi:hypothetical protein